MNEIEKVETIETQVIMSKDEASALTDDIKSTTNALYVLLKRAHDEKAWVALGYKSWSEYIDKEFEFSRARSYQLLNQARVIEQIQEASGVEVYITEREARSIKKRLPEITEKLAEVKEEKEAGMTDEEARAKAKEILETEGSDTWDTEEKVDTSHEEEEDSIYDYEPEDLDVGAPGGMPEVELTGEEKFLVENLSRTLSIFEALPDPNEISKIINNAGIDKREVVEAAGMANRWLMQLLDNLI